MHHSYEACVLEPGTTTAEPTAYRYFSLCVPESELGNKRSHYSEKPLDPN